MVDDGVMNGRRSVGHANLIAAKPGRFGRWPCRQALPGAHLLNSHAIPRREKDSRVTAAVRSANG